MAVNSFIDACQGLARLQQGSDSWRGILNSQASQQSMLPPFCVPGGTDKSHVGPFTAGAKLLFLGAGSTGTTSAAHLCEISGRRSYHRPIWQGQLQDKLFPDFHYRWKRYECFTDGLESYLVDPAKLDTELPKAGMGFKVGVVYVLNSRPLFPWLVSRLAHTLSVDPQITTTGELLWAAVKRDGFAGVNTYLRELISMRSAKHQLILNYIRRAQWQQNSTQGGTVFLLDATTEVGQETLAVKLGLPSNTSVRLYSDRKWATAKGRYNVNQSLDMNASDAFVKVHPLTAVLMRSRAGLNFSSLRGVQELVASVLLLTYPKVAQIGSSFDSMFNKSQRISREAISQFAGLCACPEGMVAV